MTRLLIFSPYALWDIHTIYEGTIAKACQQRGAEVEYLLCDGLLPECDQHWDSKSGAPRPADICQRCQVASKANLQKFDLPYRWLGAFASPTERAEALAWSQKLKPEQFRSACFKQSALGEWVLSSVISYFRKYPPDLGNERVVSVYRGFLYSAALVATGIGNYLEQNAIDAALLFNGRQSITRVAFELFRQRGIRVLTHERAEYERGHINVKANAHCMSPQPFQEFWGTWGQVPLTAEALDAALQWLIRRRYGANLAWIPFNKTAAHSSLRSRFNLSPGKRLWALFTSSMDEVAGDPLMRGPYESQADWIRDVVEWVSRREDIELVVKVHPNLGGNNYIGKAVDELRIYAHMKAELPANVRIVMPEDAVNAYSLAEEADLGLTFGSIMGLEMAMLGKPVLLASRALYQLSPQTLTVRSRQELPAMLERGLTASTSRETQRQAFRLAYYSIFVFEPTFPAIKVLGLYRAEPNYSSWADLAAGKDESLDHMCNYLIHGAPLFDSPTAQERARTSAAEDAFFEQLAHSPEYLRSVRYERWLKIRSIGRSTTAFLRRLPFGAGEAFLNLGRRRWNALLMRMERNAMAKGG
jgi:hypothetical protein